MKTILLILTLFISGNLHAQRNLSPDAFMKYYINVFNEENIVEVQKCYHFPHSVVEDGQIIFNNKESEPVVNYETLKKTGWIYSKINDVKVISEGVNTAVVVMEFSRFDKNDKPYFRTKMTYSFSKEKGYWQIINRTVVK